MNLSLADAIKEGSAVDGLPDDVVDAEEVRSRVARRELKAEKAPKPPAPPAAPAHDQGAHGADEVTK